jgi:hypothetical protein
MTIGEKSTIDNKDYAQIALDSYGVQRCLKDGVFHCFCTSGGKNTHIFIKDESGNKVHQKSLRWSNHDLPSSSTLATVEQAFKDYINAQELVEKPTNVITYEELS